GHVGADAQGVASGVLDFELTQIQFRLAARQQTHTGALGGETDCKAFADTSSGARHQYRDSLEGVHTITVVQIAAEGRARERFRPSRVRAATGLLVPR